MPGRPWRGAIGEFADFLAQMSSPPRQLQYSGKPQSGFLSSYDITDSGRIKLLLVAALPRMYLIPREVTLRPVLTGMRDTYT